ncbi:MAG: hypothetical protein K9J27_12375 [Bacteroidales bacterium]|nr:hypothetical protein [Bacteroidales bacterium]
MLSSKKPENSKEIEKHQKSIFLNLNQKVAKKQKARVQQVDRQHRKSIFLNLSQKVAKKQKARVQQIDGAAPENNLLQSEKRTKSTNDTKNKQTRENENTHFMYRELLPQSDGRRFFEII